MPKVRAISIAALVPALLLGSASMVSAQGNGNAQADSSGSERLCKVKIDRSQEAGIFDVTRQEFDDGTCLCYVYTGPASQDAGTEGKVESIEERRRCAAAGVMAIPPLAGGAGAGSAAGAGSLTGILLPIGGGAVIGGIILAGDGSPASP